MIEVPSRLSGLIQQLEAGNDPTPQQLRRVAQLQALDIAKAGEDYVREMCERNDKQTEEFANS